MIHTYIKTAWQSLLRSLMRSVRRRAATSKRRIVSPVLAGHSLDKSELRDLTKKGASFCKRPSFIPNLDVD